MKTLIVLSLLLGASFASADYRCETYANGRNFWETRADYSDARHATVARCKRARSTSDYQCERNVSCNYLGDRRRQDPPTVGSNYCYVPQTHQWVDGERFFSLVHEWTVSHGRCAVAKIATVSYSGRIYDRDGSRVAKERGGLSNSEVDSLLGIYGLYGCERFSCQESEY